MRHDSRPPLRSLDVPGALRDVGIYVHRAGGTESHPPQGLGFRGLGFRVCLQFYMGGLRFSGLGFWT